MAQDKPDFSALVGSRICHDLISPIGAIGNGLELMRLTGQGDTPEIALISASAGDASARIRFYRIAFGQGGRGQKVANGELRPLLAALSEGARVRLRCQHDGDVARDELRAVFLAMMCVESALPRGGTVTMRASGGRWVIAAADCPAPPKPWAELAGEGLTPGPGQVEFALLPQVVADLGRQLSIAQPEGGLEISF
ncbi:histidine phosphotransferase family protein [Shimia sp.]|uniref:histidine phosphotransferase family protein n=1 Tax=Shimia sp. TaxID=1954381 RepID=UPI0035620FB8